MHFLPKYDGMVLPFNIGTKGFYCGCGKTSLHRNGIAINVPIATRLDKPASCGVIVDLRRGGSTLGPGKGAQAPQMLARPPPKYFGSNSKNTHS